MYKFIHAADIHLDSPLRGLGNYEGAPVAEIRGAARRALQNLVELAIREKVKFVVIAGDVYDGDWQDFNTGLFFVKEMERLNQAGIPVYLISGNHDAVNNMSRSLRMPTNVKVFDHQKPETVAIDELHVALHGQSFATRSVTANLSEGYPSAVAGYLNIGILHTSATGREGHENYAPCTIEGLVLKGYDYWALGHVHLRETLNEKPYIAFSGNIQGRHVRECGAKGVNLVTVSDNRIEKVDFQAIDVLRWEIAQISIEEAEDIDMVIDLVKERLQELLDSTDGRTLAVRVVLTGRTALHNELNATRRRVIAEVQNCTFGLGSNAIWIEKVKINTTPLQSSSPQEQLSDEVIAVLHQEFDNIEPSRDWVEAQLGDCLRKFPGDLAGRLEIGNPEWVRGVIEEARARLIQKLNA